MIEDKKLIKKGEKYAAGVVGAIIKTRQRPDWPWVQRLIQAAYMNGFQSGVVWQKGRSIEYCPNVND